MSEAHPRWYRSNVRTYDLVDYHSVAHIIMYRYLQSWLLSSLDYLLIGVAVSSVSFCWGVGSRYRTRNSRDNKKQEAIGAISVI
jgi:hypothetical protein